MIKANELRIGNFVKQNKKNLILDLIFTINEIYSQDVYVVKSETHQAGTFEYSELEPIPLTPEILEKCGFERQNYGWTINKLNEADDSCFCLFDMNYNSGALSLKFNAAYCPCPEINYLHELQNLYFALTGEELNYTP